MACEACEACKAWDRASSSCDSLWPYSLYNNQAPSDTPATHPATRAARPTDVATCDRMLILGMFVEVL